VDQPLGSWRYEGRRSPPPFPLQSSPQDILYPSTVRDRPLRTSCAGGVQVGVVLYAGSTRRPPPKHYFLCIVPSLLARTIRPLPSIDPTTSARGPLRCVRRNSPGLNHDGHSKVLDNGPLEASCGTHWRRHDGVAGFLVQPLLKEDRPVVSASRLAQELDCLLLLPLRIISVSEPHLRSSRLCLEGAQYEIDSRTDLGGRQHSILPSRYFVP
jgi:hypothetical protein